MTGSEDPEPWPLLHSQLNRYQFNVKKCKVVKNCKENVQLPLYGECMPNSQTFTYLGVTFYADGIQWTGHFARLEGRANTTIGFLNSVGMNGSGFDLRTSKRLMTTCVMPVMEYRLVPCPMSYVLFPCPMFYVPCPMFYVLSYSLCPMSYVLCPMSHVLCPMSYALCPISHVRREKRGHKTCSPQAAYSLYLEMFLR